MSLKIIGIITAASPIMRFTKTKGVVSEKAMLHIKQVSDNTHPKEVAVKVTGELVQYARMVGYPVEVEYVIRVFPFKKDGEDWLGNDIYARQIRVVNDPKDECITSSKRGFYEI